MKAPCGVYSSSDRHKQVKHIVSEHDEDHAKDGGAVTGTAGLAFLTWSLRKRPHSKDVLVRLGSSCL